MHKTGPVLMKVFILLLFIGFTKAETLKSIEGFKRSLNVKPYAFEQVSTPVRAGLMAQKIEVRAGDCSKNTNWNDCTADRERMEFSSDEKFMMGQERWIAWSVYVPKSFVDVTPVRTSLGQIHQLDRPGNNNSKMPSIPPLLQFDIVNGQYVLRHHVLRGEFNNIVDETINYPLVSIETMRESWTDIVLHIYFGKKNGTATVYVNGQLKAKISKNLVSVSPSSFYFKYGVYRSFVSRYKMQKGTTIPTQIVYFDEVRIGKERKDVDLRMNKQLKAKD